MHDHYAREFARSPAGARRLAVALASGTGRSRENKRDSGRFRFSERWQDTIGRLIFYLPTEPLRIGVTFAFTPLAVAMLPGGGPALAVVAQAAAAETDAGPLVSLVCRLEVARNGWDSCRCKRLREWSLPSAAGFHGSVAGGFAGLQVHLPGPMRIDVGFKVDVHPLGRPLALRLRRAVCGRGQQRGSRLLETQFLDRKSVV